MKRLAQYSLLLLLSLLLSTPHARGEGDKNRPEWADSLRSLYLYTEAQKCWSIHADTLAAEKLLIQATQNDSLYAPAYYSLATLRLGKDRRQAMADARKAYRADSANIWYEQLYGQTLLTNGCYEEALKVFRSLREHDPKNPDFYRIVAALYELQKQPFSAIAILDSAEMRFGRIPMLSAMKRHLLVATMQVDKAIEEARKLAEEVPYEAEHHVILARLYGAARQDSAAHAEYRRALEIDSTSMPTLLSMEEYLEERGDFRAMFGITEKLFRLPQMPLEMKLEKLRHMTGDMQFYRDNYFQINNLFTILAINHPGERDVTEAYARHKLASGELEQALELYKTAMDGPPVDKEFYLTVIDIEAYLQRPDSVRKYIARGLRHFPESPRLHIVNGNAKSMEGDHRGALKIYRKSLKYAQNDSLRSTIHGVMGDTWHLMSRYDALDEGLIARGQEVRIEEWQKKYLEECYAAYERSLALNPDNTLVLNNYAYFLAVEGRDLERALKMADRVLELTDNNPTYLDTKAWVLYRLGRLDEAKKTMQQAIAFDGQRSAGLLAHYGDILDALGERFMAEIYWRKALEKGYEPQRITLRFESEK